MYRILYTRQARRNIAKLPLDKKRQIKKSVERIAADPGIGKNLTGELRGLQSYRTGMYRIIYRVHRREITVLILTIGHRKDIYKQTKRKPDS